MKRSITLTGLKGKQRQIALVLVVIVVLLFLSLLVTQISAPQKPSYNWVFQEALQTIGVSFPVNISDVTDNSHVGRYFAIDVSFKADPATTHVLAAQICNGELYQRYDPFNAESSPLTSIPNAILVTDDAIHYSFSLNTADTIFGNRCRQNPAVKLEIRVDKSDPHLFAVRLSTIRDSVLFFPSVPLAHYETPLAEADFPLVVVGIRQDIDGYLLVGETLCFEARNAAYWLEMGSRRNSVPAETVPYIGADVRMRIDDIEMPSATINTDGKLVPYANIEEYRSWEWNYCIKPPDATGIHTVEIIVTINGNMFGEYLWQYEAG
jgi:hypothetical protein